MTCCEEVPVLSHKLPALADPGQPRSPALWEPSHTQSVPQGPGRRHEDLCSCFPAEVPGISFFLESGVSLPSFRWKGSLSPAISGDLGGSHLSCAHQSLVQNLTSGTGPLDKQKRGAETSPQDGCLLPVVHSAQHWPLECLPDT